MQPAFLGLILCTCSVRCPLVMSGDAPGKSGSHARPNKGDNKTLRGRVVPEEPQEMLIPMTEEIMNMMLHPVWEPCTQDMADEGAGKTTNCAGCSNFGCKSCRITRMSRPAKAKQFYERNVPCPLVTSNSMCVQQAPPPPCSWCGYPTHMICDWCPMGPGLPAMQLCSECDKMVGMCRVCYSVRQYETEGVKQSCASCETNPGRHLGRHLSKCGRCFLARYCSTACQANDWPDHKKLCRYLAAHAFRPPLLFRWLMPGGKLWPPQEEVPADVPRTDGEQSHSLMSTVGAKSKKSSRRSSNKMLDLGSSALGDRGLNHHGAGSSSDVTSPQQQTKTKGKQCLTQATQTEGKECPAQ